MQQQRMTMSSADGDQVDLNIYHNLKTVELMRGRYGYGFDLKGDRPAVIGSVRKQSPADECGLAEGDLVIAINNIKVTDLDHDNVVRLIGQSKTSIILQVTKVGGGTTTTSTTTTTTKSRHLNNLNMSSKSCLTATTNTDDDDDLVFNNYADYDYFYNYPIKYHNGKTGQDAYDDDESIDTSEDDCSMQPFYVHKSRGNNNHNNNLQQHRNSSSRKSFNSLRDSQHMLPLTLSKTKQLGKRFSVLFFFKLFFFRNEHSKDHSHSIRATKVFELFTKNTESP